MMLAPGDWDRIGADLDASGCAVVRQLLSGDECKEYAAAYNSDGPYRSRVLMERHGFGKGEYKYFDYPLPPGVASLRHGVSRLRSGLRHTLGVIFHDAE